jgi:hypothetical protein
VAKVVVKEEEVTTVESVCVALDDDGHLLSHF